MSLRALPSGLAEAIIVVERKKRAAKHRLNRPPSEDLSGTDTEAEGVADQRARELEAAVAAQVAAEASRAELRKKAGDSRKSIQAAAQVAEAKARASALLAAKQKRREEEQAKADARVKKEQEQAKEAEARRIAQRLLEQQSRALEAKASAARAKLAQAEQSAHEKGSQEEYSEELGTSFEPEEDDLDEEEGHNGSEWEGTVGERDEADQSASGSEEDSVVRAAGARHRKDLRQLEAFVSKAKEAEDKARREADAAEAALVAQELAKATADAALAATTRANLAEARRKQLEQSKRRDKERDEALQQERERVDRQRERSRSPDLYLDRLADRDEEFSHGNSFVPHRLLPRQSPESSRSHSFFSHARLFLRVPPSSAAYARLDVR
jgi:hypothetical protein